MTNQDAIEDALSGVRKVPGVEACLVVSRAEATVRTEGGQAVDPEVLASAATFARILLSGTAERLGEFVGTHRFAARRIEDVVVCVIATAETDENTLHRKLNVMAIDVQVRRSKEGPEPIVAQLRDAYWTTAGGLSALVFDRAMADLGQSRRLGDLVEVRRVVVELASSVTPPAARLALLRRIDQLLNEATSAKTPSTTMRAVGPARSFATPPTKGRKTTVPQMAAIASVARETIGAFGDLVVRRALETIQKDDTTPVDAEALLEAVAAQLPEHKRAQFLVEGRAALEGGEAPR